MKLNCLHTYKVWWRIYNNLDEEMKKQIDLRIKKLVPEILRGSAFTDRKITDTPTDDLQVVPRKYVNMYGSIAGRPQVSVVGQQYFSTTDGYPIFRNSNNAWVSATGSVVG